MTRLHPAVKAIIQQNDKFLIIKQKIPNGTVWDLPGGKVNFGESPYDTLIREVMEETCLSIKVIKPLGPFWFFRYDGDQIICSTFLCTADNYDVDLTKNPANEKIIEYKWVTKNEFLTDKYMVNDSLKKLFNLL